jgi:diguanylate cyclase (GGDEF)-like protein/PAS domain S-box-containing protein
MAPAKIMIVEDEGITAMHLGRVLDGLGYSVITAVSSAEEAIERAGERRPDLVLMDIRLRGEMDGVQAAQVLRERFNIPVIFLTAHADDAILERAKVTEPYGYILKPFAQRDVRVTIEMALHKHRMDARLKRRGDWYASALESLGDAVIVTDAQGLVKFMNPLAESLTGWPLQEALDRDITDVFRIANRRQRELTEHPLPRAMRRGEVIHLEEGAILIARNGQERPIEDSAAPIREPDGTISGGVLVFRDGSARRQAEERLFHLAHHDALTGLPNRALFHDRLEQAIALAKRERAMVAVHLLDLDRFKETNDTLGHVVGDTLLQAAADRLVSCVRETDTVSRLGGDEFAVIQTQVESADDAAALAGKIISAFTRPFIIDEHDIHSSVSVGITIYPIDDEDPNLILKNADAALYRAKEEGRDNYQFFIGETKRIVESRRSLDRDLRHALERGEFELFYQPAFDLKTGRITAAEALLRWRHPERGLVLPKEFIPTADRTGLILSIGKWALLHACVNAGAWQDAAPGLKVSVNLAPAQIKRQELVTVLKRVLQDAGIPAACLEVELTEDIIGDHTQVITAFTMQRLRQMGVGVTIDDFGKGYASLSYLNSFPISKLKIDQSLISSLPEDASDATLVRAAICAGRTFGLRVVAEGVETEEQLAWVQDEGCDEAQGTLLGPPVPAEEFSRLLRDRRCA